MKYFIVFCLALFINCQSASVQDVDITFLKYVKDFDIKTGSKNWGRYVSVQFDYKMPWGVAGLANGMGNNDAVFIWISKPIWNVLTENQKEWLIWHELAHDAFNIKHNETEIMSLSIPRNVTNMDLARAKYKLINLINGKQK